MDGVYVPNFALSWDQVAYCRKRTNLPLEVHLMVEDLKPHINFILNCRVDVVYLHVENEVILESIDRLKSMGIHVGLAINPETTIESFESLIDRIDSVLMMRVKPGFAGQKPIDGVDEKIFNLIKAYPNLCVTVDGAVTHQVVQKLSEKGVRGFVLGTSCLFHKAQSYKETLQALSTLRK